jgi:hypothetical protein
MGLGISVGFGAILNLLAAATVLAGGFLKAREEHLIEVWAPASISPQESIGEPR